MKKLIFITLLILASTSYGFTEIGFWTQSGKKTYFYKGKELKLSEVEKVISGYQNTRGDFTVYIYISRNVNELKDHEEFLKLHQKYKLTNIIIRSWKDKDLKKENKQKLSTVERLLKKIKSEVKE